LNVGSVFVQRFDRVSDAVFDRAVRAPRVGGFCEECVILLDKDGDC
jgi:hypothetical protein